MDPAMDHPTPPIRLENPLTQNDLVSALSSLNQIGLIINNIGYDPSHNIETILKLIAESAVKVIPEASSVIYTYDSAQQRFVFGSRFSAGDQLSGQPFDQPRSNGMGQSAIHRQSRILSYEETVIKIHPALVRDGACAVACYPLLAARNVVGVLYLYLNRDRQFSVLELQMLENFVNQAAMAIYHASMVENVKRHLSRKEEEVARLQRASLLISSRQRLDDTLDTILKMAFEVTNARYGCFRLVDHKANNLVTAAIAGESLSRPVTENLAIDSTSVMGWVALNRQPVCITDVKDEPWASIYQPLDHDLEIHSELTVPLIGASGRLEGVLNLESPVSGGFNEEDNHLLQAFASQAVIAIQEVLLVDALQEIAEQILSKPVNQVLSHLTERACDLLNAAAGAIWTLEGETLILRAASAGHQHGETVPLNNSLIGQAVLQREPVVSSDVRADPTFQYPQLAHTQGWVRALVVPLMASQQPDQEPVGVFSVYSTETTPGQFTKSDWDKKVLTILAHYATLAVQNTARQEAMRTAQNQRTVSETFAALGDVAVNLLHQLNNKFGSIPVRIEGIQDKCETTLLNDPYLSNNLTKIEISAREAMSAVRENLNLLHPIQTEPLNIQSCIEEALSTRNLPSTISIKLENLDALPLVFAGRHSLNLVFSNLLENAAQAMGNQGTITIHGKTKEDQVITSMSDTGPGIPPHQQAAIFELNYSGIQSIPPGKLGFGLWWVKALMARLDGSVWVESDGVSGTTFHLRLPKTNSVTNGEAA
jgi:GAF domain-containing protein